MKTPTANGCWRYRWRMSRSRAWDRFVSIQLRMRAGKTVELEPDTAENCGRDRPTHRGHGRPGHRGNPKPARLHRQPGKPLTRITVAYLRIFLGLPGPLTRQRLALREQGWHTAGELGAELGIPVRTVQERSHRGDGIVVCTTFTIGTRIFSKHNLRENGHKNDLNLSSMAASGAQRSKKDAS